MSETTQPPLLTETQLPAEPGKVTSNTSLQAAMGIFEQHMRDEGFSIHTRKAFASDLRLLGRFLGIGTAIGAIGAKDLNDFLYWLQFDRGKPCSPKSYARRVTTLKVFFGWLNNSDVLVIDPSKQVAQRSVSSPLPVVPSDEALEKALDVTQGLREDAVKPDARPHLLLTLLLQTGIKKGEAMSIIPNHIVRDDPDEPFVYIRYKNPRMRYKERKIELEADWLEVLDEYLAQYKPTSTLFTCTARNLEYVLSDVAEVAKLDKGLLSFENLRWASALQDFGAGVDEETIRMRLGLSKVTWRETKKKLRQLAEQRALKPG